MAQEAERQRARELEKRARQEKVTNSCTRSPKLLTAG